MRMSLTTRLTTFFLGALALVLSGFAATLFLLAQSYLQLQVDERLEAALGNLVAAIEFHDKGLEWEPNERLVALGQGPEPEEVRWAVRRPDGTVIDRSRNLAANHVFTTLPLPGADDRPRPHRVLVDGRPWRVIRRRLAAGESGTIPTGQYAEFVLTAGLDLGPVDATLGTLVRVTTVLSLALWLLAAALGRRFCRRALVPVTRMSDAARKMGADELERRLPVPRTDDELQDLGDTFNGLLARIQEAFERQRRFTGDASHQLRTPLAAILGQIEVALRRDRSPDDYRRVLTLVHDKAAHLGQMVEMLLFLSRADAESELPDLEALDLSAWLDAQRERWVDHPRGGDLRFSTGIGRQTARVHPPLLAQLLDNLIDNACKYSAAGTPIDIGIGRELDQVAVSVEDRGDGIGADDLCHIFEPFFRSPRARRDGRSGVGLGLSVAQRIADSFHGRLVARSEPGVGSRFVLLLPEVSDAPSTLDEIPLRVS